MGLNEIKKKYNKTVISTGDKIMTYGSMTSEKMKEEAIYLNGLEEKFKIEPMSLTMEELIDLKNRRGESCNKINLNYRNGFVMLSKDEFTNNSLDDMPYDVQGITQKIGRSSNKDGCIIYPNRKPVQNITDLMKFLEISRKIWNKFSVYNEKYGIIKKEKIEGVTYLIVNPLFYSGSYEITFFRFLVFGKFLKDQGYINDLDYAILCKKHSIIPEK